MPYQHYIMRIYDPNSDVTVGRFFCLSVVVVKLTWQEGRHRLGK